MLKTFFNKIMLFSLGLIPMSVMAISLGESEILSSLGEQIRVEVEVLQWEDSDLEQLEAALASEANFDAFGLDYLPVFTDLQLSILEPDNGELKILMTSSVRMQEPFLDILLLLRWPGGSLLREYILLFDPPVLRTSTPQINTTLIPVVEPEIVVEQEEIAPEPAQIQEVIVETIDETIVETIGEPIVEPIVETDIVETIIERRLYAVQPGDSLLNIGLQFRPAEDNENLYQMLLSIYALNPDAFEDGNITLLIADEEILIPGSNDINNIDQATAEARYNELMEEGAAVFDVEQEPLPVINNLAPANQQPVEEVQTNQEIVQDEVQGEQIQIVQEASPDDALQISNNLDSGVVQRGTGLSDSLAETPFQNIVQDREQQRQQLEAQVEGMRLQIGELQAVSVSLTRTVEIVRTQRAAQQKSVNLVAYILIGFALLLTLALIFFVMRGPKRGS